MTNHRLTPYSAEKLCLKSWNNEKIWNEQLRWSWLREAVLITCQNRKIKKGMQVQKDEHGTEICPSLKQRLTSALYAFGKTQEWSIKCLFLPAALSKGFFTVHWLSVYYIIANYPLHQPLELLSHLNAQRLRHQQFPVPEDECALKCTTQFFVLSTFTSDMTRIKFNS